MTETVVHVTTLEQWKSVLDVWFKQGYMWASGDKEYHEGYFDYGERKLLLTVDNDIQMASDYAPYIEYSEFISQQKEDNKMATVYEVSQSVFDKLQMIKAHGGSSLIGAITFNAQFIKSIEVVNKAILRYLADDPAIEFKVKEQLYRLWRIDDVGDEVYMRINGFGTPDWGGTSDAFIAPLEEIKKWKTPAWDIEKAD
ncbi:hypothetical protein ACEN35_03100 [Leuconostoc mesenteroides]|uniref:hypothetical protein n=1 Tax=Leuconostoc mesenteroides TaxID=1245 RepID=UPI003883C585